MGSIQIIHDENYKEVDPTSGILFDSQLKKQGTATRSGRSTESQVLSQMCDNIHQNQALLNGHVRRMFSLQNVLMSSESNEKFLEKKSMMNQLGEYDNLIKAIGALQYTSKYMANIVPLAFQAWKEMVFEKRANRLHDMLSSPSSHHSEKVIFHIESGKRHPDPTSERLKLQDDEDDGLVEAEDDYEEYFFKDQGEDEQYVRLVE
jgi:hypothetical protein